MTEQLLWQLCDQQVRFFGTLVGPRGEEASDGRFVEELVKIVPALSRLMSSLGKVQDVISKAALKGRIEKIQETGEGIDGVLVAAAGFLEVVQTRCREAIAAGYSIESVPEIERMVAECRALRETWIRSWPFVDPEMLERSGIEFSSGQYQSAKDALHELRNLHH